MKHIPYSCCEIERYEESEQISSPVKEREKPQMNFIEDTKGSTWDQYIGMNCRKILYQNSYFQNMMGHPRTGHRPKGNHQAHTSPFWLQVCHDMEQYGNVLFRLLGQQLGIFCTVFLVGFATLQGQGARQEVLCVLVNGWVLLGERTREGAGSLYGKKHHSASGYEQLFPCLSC